MDTLEITFIVSWLVLSIIVALCARYKRRNTLLYFILSLVFSPVLVGLVVYRLEHRTIITDSENQIAKPKLITDKRYCKKCKRELKPGYSICSFCYTVNLIQKE